MISVKNSFKQMGYFLVDPNLYRLNFLQSTGFGTIDDGGQGRPLNEIKLAIIWLPKDGYLTTFSYGFILINLILGIMRASFQNLAPSKLKWHIFNHGENYWTKNDDLEFNNRRVFTLDYPQKSYPKGWMWTEFLPWAYSFETGGWLYFELAKDVDGNPVMNYYDYETDSWDLYGPSLTSLIK